MELAMHLKPRNASGFLFLTCAGGLTASAVMLVESGSIWRWLLAQMVFALAFLQWFVILHESGHQTLFRHRRFNLITGHIAGFFALIPFHAWQLIHARHHRWTGWQDLDATTASLVPRVLAPWERFVIRAAWRTHLPLFSVLYRLSNFWHLPRVRKYVTGTQHKRIVINTIALLAVYAFLLAWIGVVDILACGGLGLVLSLMIQDPLLLSQHTHIPQHLSDGQTVKPFPPHAQGRFTRSLRFPKWFSGLILHFDAHELHHMYIRVPGYDLHKIPSHPQNEVHWWEWLRAVKRLPADVFLFQNRTQTGFKL